MMKKYMVIQQLLVQHLKALLIGEAQFFVEILELMILFLHQEEVVLNGNLTLFFKNMMKKCHF
jgi:hypothetical protein